jgi:hypothetical protein
MKLLPPTKKNHKAAARFSAEIRRLNKRILGASAKMILSRIRKKPDEVFTYIRHMQKTVLNRYRKESEKPATSFVEALIYFYNKQINAILGKHKKLSFVGIEKTIKNNILKKCRFYVNKICKDFFKRIVKAIKDFGSDFKKTKKRFKEIEEIADTHTGMVSRTQTSRILAEINTARYLKNGIKKYVWSSSEDGRTVGNPQGLYPVGNPEHEDHFHREGKIFRFDTPPEDGPPGYPINCRCVALPVLEDKEEEKNA